MFLIISYFFSVNFYVVKKHVLVKKNNCIAIYIHINECLYLCIHTILGVILYTYKDMSLCICVYMHLYELLCMFFFKIVYTYNYMSNYICV